MERGEVHLVRLSPTTGSEIRKTRPCLVVSPDELNQELRTAQRERVGASAGASSAPSPAAAAAGEAGVESGKLLTEIRDALLRIERRLDGNSGG
ncbi:MAG: type II toxin-antitoxin system PemK/MazF family toxin [Acidobacteria bacterium]|nr:type II toxin-antitoxin system PemK/MazF family toxin [Acidobacteriota bacterium]